MAKPSRLGAASPPALSSFPCAAAMLIAFNLKVMRPCAAGLPSPLAVAPLVPNSSAHGYPPAAQEIIELKPGSMDYRTAGDFTRAGGPAEAPLVRLTFAKPLAIMKRQVSS